MALTSLRRSDQRFRSAVLAETAGYFLPDPTRTENARRPEGLVADVIGEISKKIPSNRGVEFSSVLRQKIITKELRDNLISNSDIGNIRDRIGQKGLLSSSLYKISFRDQFLNLNVPMGVSKALVEQAILRPTGVEHLFPRENGILGLEEHSLFTGVVPGHDDGCVLVLTVRHNAQLFVDGAWLVFFEDVGIDPTASPVTALKALALKYGSPTIAGNSREKFILFETFDIEPHETRDLVRFEHGLRMTDCRASYAMSYGKLNVALAFSIDLLDYINDLKKHGVKVTRQLPKVVATK